MMLSLLVSCAAGQKQRGAGPEPERITTNALAGGLALEVEFRKGPGHNHPLMAVWLEDEDGSYIETLYVAKSIGTGIFGHGTVKEGHWAPGPVSRPAALPRWWHLYGYLPGPDNPVPDAITGPTPEADFILETKSTVDLPSRFRVVMEINQSWDWNEYWSNVKYPDNEAYKTSSQPAVVYEAVVDRDVPEKIYPMQLVGRSHYAGEDGKLYNDLETLTTAREIAASVKVRILP